MLTTLDVEILLATNNHNNGVEFDLKFVYTRLR